MRQEQVEVRHATAGDAAVVARLRHALWPEGSEAEHRQELDRFFTEPGRAGAILVAVGPGGVMAFAEVSIRPSAEGCRK